ncbi:MAG: hypothetical protein M1416_00135 [Candidatus Pacearchaeota archaeon]|nr:hypothetical protein [Candidatus Pacearchaeota archaeon]
MVYHNIEVIITRDKEQMRLSGQVNNIQYGNPEVTIFEKEGNIGATQTPPYNMKLSEFMYELETQLSGAYSFKEFRPMKFSMSINIGEAKE